MQFTSPCFGKPPDISTSAAREGKGAAGLSEGTEYCGLKPWPVDSISSRFLIHSRCLTLTFPASLEPSLPVSEGQYQIE